MKLVLRLTSSNLGKLGLVTTLFSLIVFFGCKKFDSTLNRLQATDEEITARFFNVSSNLNTTVKRIMETMSALNKKEPFVTNLVNNYGYVIWDKSLLLEGNSSLSKNAGKVLGVESNGDTIVLLPLVKPDSTYVDAFFKVVVNADTVLTEFYRNSDYIALPKQNSDYAANHPEITTAESFAVMMMYLDKEVFGYTKFDVIDKTLFVSSERAGDTAHTKKQIEFDNGGTNSFQWSCITYTEITITSHVDCPWLKAGLSCPNAPPGECDGCVEHCISYQTTTTTRTSCYITGGGGVGGIGFPTFPTGGGGGNGNGGGSPPPCPIVGPIQSNYAIPECPPIPNPWPPVTSPANPPSQNPCAIADNIGKRLDTIYWGAKIDSMLTSIPNLATEPNEKGFVGYRKFTVNPQNVHDTTFTGYRQSQIITGTDSSINGSLNTPYLCVIACFVHTHPPSGYAAQSAHDVYDLIELKLSEPYVVGNFVKSANGSEYAIAVTDYSAASAFYATKPQNLLGTMWNEETPIGKAFKKAQKYFEEKVYKGNPDKITLSYERAMSAVLKEYNTGITLFKKQTSGNFKPIIINTSKDPQKPKRIIYTQLCL